MGEHNDNTNSKGRYLLAGDTAPTEDLCINGVFIDQDATAGEGVFVNAGTVASASFSKIPTEGGTNAFTGANSFSGATTITGAVTQSAATTVADDVNINFGTGADTNISWDNTRGALVVDANNKFLSAHGLSDRFELVWVAGARGKPGLTADIIPASADDSGDGATKAEFATMHITDKEFEVLGTNCSSDDVTFNAEGGIVFTTDGADGDEVFLLPHLDTSQTAWSNVTWGTDQETEWECVIVTGADITNSIVWAGLKLTSTDVVATDADQVFFRYENAINTGKFQAVNSIGNVDVSADSGVTVAASTVYHLAIKISATRIATFYINGALVATSLALTDATDFIPYVCVAADGAAEPKTLTVRGQAISRLFA